MKLYLLKPRENVTKRSTGNPWDPWYDKAFGFVIRAESAIEARTLAHNNAGDENRGEFLNRKTANTTKPWLDTKYSSCEPLDDKGEVEVIIKDFASA